LRVSENKEIAEWVRNAIDFALLTNVRFYPYRNHVKISEIGSCPKKIWERYNNKELEISQNAIRNLNKGILITNLLESVIGETDISKKFVRIEYKDAVFVGNVDIIIPYKLLVELKTVKWLPKQPYEHHLKQLSLYVYALGLDLGYLVYILPTDFNIRVFEVFPNAYDINAFLEEGYEHWQLLQGLKEPYAKPSRLCKWCQSLDWCQEGQKFLKDLNGNNGNFLD